MNPEPKKTLTPAEEMRQIVNGILDGLKKLDGSSSQERGPVLEFQLTTVLRSMGQPPPKDRKTGLISFAEAMSTALDELDGELPAGLEWGAVLLHGRALLSNIQAELRHFGGQGLKAVPTK